MAVNLEEELSADSRMVDKVGASTENAVLPAATMATSRVKAVAVRLVALGIRQQQRYVRGQQSLGNTAYSEDG